MEDLEGSDNDLKLGDYYRFKNGIRKVTKILL
jgi:hypothetical protein